MKKLACLFILALALSAFGQATTSVMFPVNSMFGGAIAGKPITITAQNALASDGVNIWAGTYTIIPPSATNPVIGLYPGQYLMTIAGVVKPSRFTVPTTTNVLDVTSLITSGPLIYFNPTNGLFNLWPGSGVTFVTNSDGSITVSSTGGGGGGSGTITNAIPVNSRTVSVSGPTISIGTNYEPGGAVAAFAATLGNGATNATGTNLMDAAKGLAGFQWLQHLTSGSTNPGSVQIAADSAWGGGPWIDMDNTLDQITIHATVVNFSDVATATVSGQFYGHLFGDADTADLASLATGLAPGSASNRLAAAVQPGTAPSLGLANVTGTLPAATLPGNVVTNQALALATRFEAAHGITDAQAHRDVELAFAYALTPGSGFVDGIILYPRFNPQNATSMMGNPYFISNGVFVAETPTGFGGGLAGLSTNGITFPLPQVLTNWTVVWSAYVDAYSADTILYGQAADSHMLVWGLTESNSTWGSYVGVEGRNGDEMFYREKTNIWSITVPATTTSADSFQRPSQSTAGIVDVFQHGSVYALTGDGQGNHFTFLDSSVSYFYLGNPANHLYNSPVTNTLGLNTLNISMAPTWNTNLWDASYPNTNFGYGGAQSVYLIFNTTNYQATVTGYKMAAVLDGRPRIFMFGTSLYDPTWYPSGVGQGILQNSGGSLRFMQQYQKAHPERVFQNWSAAGGTVSNQLYGFEAAGFAQGMVTNLPQPRIPVTVYSDSQNNDARNGISAAYTVSNFANYYLPMANMGAQVIPIITEMEWTNENGVEPLPGAQSNTNLAVNWDMLNTNPLTSFVAKRINTAQFKGQVVMNTNTGPWAFTLDGVHFFGNQHSNLWTSEINYFESGVWTLPSFGYLATPTIYSFQSQQFNGTFVGVGDPVSDFYGNAAGLTNIPSSAITGGTGTGSNALALLISGAAVANQSNAWVSLAGLTNIAQVNFTVGVYTNMYFAGCSNMQAGFSFTVWLTQSSTQPTNLIAFNTNFWQPQVFGQILTMPTNSISSAMLLSCFATATNVVKFTQTLFP